MKYKNKEIEKDTAINVINYMRGFVDSQKEQGKEKVLIPIENLDFIFNFIDEFTEIKADIKEN